MWWWIGGAVVVALIIFVCWIMSDVLAGFTLDDEEDESEDIESNR